MPNQPEKPMDSASGPEEEIQKLLAGLEQRHLGTPIPGFPIPPKLIGAALGAILTKVLGGSIQDAFGVFAGSLGLVPESPGAAALMGIEHEKTKDGAEGILVCRHGVFECPECAKRRLEEQKE